MHSEKSDNLLQQRLQHIDEVTIGIRFHAEAVWERMEPALPQKRTTQKWLWASIAVALLLACIGGWLLTTKQQQPVVTTAPKHQNPLPETNEPATVKTFFLSAAKESKPIKKPRHKPIIQPHALKVFAAMVQESNTQQKAIANELLSGNTSPVVDDSIVPEKKVATNKPIRRLRVVHVNEFNDQPVMTDLLSGQADQQKRNVGLLHKLGIVLEKQPPTNSE